MESNNRNKGYGKKNLGAFPRLPNQWNTSSTQNNFNNTNNVARNNPFGNNNVSHTCDNFDWNGRNKRKRLDESSDVHALHSNNQFFNDEYTASNHLANVKKFYEWVTCDEKSRDEKKLDDFVPNDNDINKIMEQIELQEKQVLEEKQEFEKSNLQKRLYKYAWDELAELEKKYNKKQSEIDLSLEQEKSQELEIALNPKSIYLSSYESEIIEYRTKNIEEKYKQKKLEKCISIEKEKTLELQEKYMEKQMGKYTPLDLKKLQAYDKKLQLEAMQSQVKKEEEKYKQKYIEELMSIEQKKLHEQEKKLKLEQIENHFEEQFIALMTTIKFNIDDGITQCSICAENNADTAVIPCGHKFFCHECIDLYHKTYPRKGCPVCRKEILCVTKIFS